MKRIACLILFLPTILHAATSRHVKEGDVRAININFEAHDRELSNTVHKTSTETVHGKKYFDEVDVDTLTVSALVNVFKYKVGSFTSASGTGNQSVTGVGFKPRLVILFLGRGSASLFRWSLGAFTSTDQWSYGGDSSDTDSGGLAALSTSSCYSEVSNTGVVVDQASVTSMDSDGFTINWTTISAGSRSVGYIAFQ
jgi:hypothetical protein